MARHNLVKTNLRAFLTRKTRKRKGLQMRVRMIFLIVERRDLMMV